MQRLSLIRKSVFYGLFLLGAFCTVFSFIKAYGWINKPFPGLLAYHPPYAGSFSSRDWPGKQAGIKYLDRIISVDGHPVLLGKDLIDIVEHKQEGDDLQFVIQTKAGPVSVSLPVTVFSIKDFFLIFLSPFLCGIAIFALGIVAYILKPDKPSSMVFLVMCFGLGIYGITGFEIQSSYMFVRLHYLVLSIFPSCFFHLGLVFPERKQILQRLPWLEYLVYLPGVAGAVLYQVYFSTFPEITGSKAFSWVPSYIGLSIFARLYVLLGFVTLVGLVLHSYFRPVSNQSRQRAKLMMFGVGLAFIPPGVLTASMLTAKVYFPFNFIPFFTIFFPISIAYAIVRHNLFDADTIIRRTVGYFIVTAIVIGVYALVSVGMNVYFDQYQLAQSKVFPILFTIAVILVFNPLRDRIQLIVDRLFFRKEYDYGAIIEKVGGAMTSLLNLDDILKNVTRTFMEEMFLNNSSVMLLTPDGSTFKVRWADGEMKDELRNLSFHRDEPLMDVLINEKKELTRYDLSEDPKYQAVCEACNTDFDALHASLMVPLVFQGQVIGLLNLGDKKSGKFFNREDIELLRSIAHQSAVAIENARLFQENLEKQRMEEELNIARDLQMSMLPAQCPEIAGFEIAASSMPARQVGGDFYDFIIMQKDRMGIVIGDVTGKSVSGALVMSSSRSVFRMLSEENLSVSQIMNRANRRIKKDVKSGIFVALLYAVLDADEKILGLCSAGQTQPVHYAAATGEANLIQTEGDTFPLGIIPEAEYLETRMTLQPQDKVLLYTDGIVEAMNTEKEIFGFERLLKHVRENGHLDAQALLAGILQRVQEFAGEMPQHDDLTVIVVDVK